MRTDTPWPDGLVRSSKPLPPESMTRFLLIAALLSGIPTAAEAGPAKRLANNLGVSRAEARRIINRRLIVGSAEPTGFGNTPANGCPGCAVGTIGSGIGGIGAGQ